MKVHGHLSFGVIYLQSCPIAVAYCLLGVLHVFCHGLPICLFCSSIPLWQLLVIGLLWYLHLQTLCCSPSLLWVAVVLLPCLLMLDLLSEIGKDSFFPCLKIDHLSQGLVLHQVKEWLGKLCSGAGGHYSVCIPVDVSEVELTSYPHCMVIVLSSDAFFCLCEAFHIFVIILVWSVEERTMRYFWSLSWIVTNINSQLLFSVFSSELK